MQSFIVKTEEYIGPFDKILNLIDEEKISINKLSLSEITDEFLAYTSSLEKNNNPIILADFLVIASKLVLIKSQVLLNQSLTKEEEEEIKNFENSLIVLNNLKPAKEIINSFWGKKEYLFSRPYLFGQPPIFYPPPNISPFVLKSSLEELTKSFKKFFLETKEIKVKIIKLGEKIQELVELIEEKGEISFDKMIEKSSRSEMVVYFLALLHLFHDEKIIIEQENHFSAITLKKLEKIRDKE